MSNIASKLSTLNSLRIAAGKKPLASWKNSEAELDQRITQLAPAPTVDIPADKSPDLAVVAKAIEEAVASGKVTKIDAGVTAKKTKAPVAKQLDKQVKKLADIDKATDKKARKAPVNASASGSDFSAYVAKLGVDPKVARARLRRAGLSAPYSVADAKRVLK